MQLPTSLIDIALLRTLLIVAKCPVDVLHLLSKVESVHMCCPHVRNSTARAKRTVSLVVKEGGQWWWTH